MGNFPLYRMVKNISNYYNNNRNKLFVTLDFDLKWYEIN